MSDPVLKLACGCGKLPRGPGISGALGSHLANALLTFQPAQVPQLTQKPTLSDPVLKPACGCGKLPRGAGISGAPRSHLGVVGFLTPKTIMFRKFHSWNLASFSESLEERLAPKHPLPSIFCSKHVGAHSQERCVRYILGPALSPYFGNASGACAGFENPTLPG